MSVVVLDIITSALKELGVIVVGETLTADDANDALSVLNRLLDQWAAERPQIYTAATRTTFTITSGTGAYTVGTGADVSVARPVFVDNVKYVNSSSTPSTEFPLSMLTDDAYAAVIQKTLTAPLPTCYYYRPTYPTGTLMLWPIPTATTLTGALYAPTAVAEFLTLQDVVALPPGYRRMLVTNLAVEIAPSYDRRVDPQTKKAAMESMEVVKRANFRLMDLSIERAALGQGARSGRLYNINTDQ
jgi:hypothetical protein